MFRSRGRIDLLFGELIGRRVEGNVNTLPNVSDLTECLRLATVFMVAKGETT